MNEIILNDFKNTVKFIKQIAKEQEIPVAKVLEIIKSNFTEEEIREIKENKSERRAIKSRSDFFKKYHSDEQFRKKIIRQAKNFHYKKKFN